MCGSVGRLQELFQEVKIDKRNMKEYEKDKKKDEEKWKMKLG